MKQKEKNVIALDVSPMHTKLLLGSYNDTASREKPFFELQGIVTKGAGISKRGSIQNKGMLTASIGRAVDELIEFSGYDIYEVCLSYTHPNIRYIRKTIGKTIRQQQSLHITKEWLQTLREKITVSLKKEYRQETCVYFEMTSIVADGEEIVHDPYEYTVSQAVRVEYVCLLAPLTFIDNILECAEQSAAIRSAQPAVVTNRIFLSDEQREQGAIVCDIGAEFTNITVCRDSTLIGTHIAPFGGNTITNELALLKKISITEAEEIKIALHTDEKILKKTEVRSIEKKIEEMIKKHILSYIKELDSSKNFPGGIILIGSGAHYLRMDQIMEKVLKLYTAYPRVSYHIQSQQRMPQSTWHAAYATLHSITTQEYENYSHGYEEKRFIWQRFMNMLHSITKIFL